MNQALNLSISNSFCGSFKAGYCLGLFLQFADLSHRSNTLHKALTGKKKWQKFALMSVHYNYDHMCLGKTTFYLPDAME